MRAGRARITKPFGKVSRDIESLYMSCYMLWCGARNSFFIANLSVLYIRHNIHIYKFLYIRKPRAVYIYIYIKLVIYTAPLTNPLPPRPPTRGVLPHHRASSLVVQRTATTHTHIREYIDDIYTLSSVELKGNKNKSNYNNNNNSLMPCCAV